jgi:hypothetical protein
LRDLSNRSLNPEQRISGGFEADLQVPCSRGKSCRPLEKPAENAGSISANGGDVAERQSTVEVRGHKAPGFLKCIGKNARRLRIANQESLVNNGNEGHKLRFDNLALKRSFSDHLPDQTSHQRLGFAARSQKMRVGFAKGARELSTLKRKPVKVDTEPELVKTSMLTICPAMKFARPGNE